MDLNNKVLDNPYRIIQEFLVKIKKANYTHPLRNAACMRASVTRWELDMTIGYCVSFLILLRTSKIKHDPYTMILFSIFLMMKTFC